MGSALNAQGVQFDICVTIGALTLSNTIATALGDTATLSLVSGTTLDLNANATTSEIIGALILGGTST